MAATSFFGGEFFGGEFFNTPAPPADVTIAPGGGDSTRLRKRGRRPKRFWEAAIEEEKKNEIAEAVFDAVADAYLIEKHTDFVTQVGYLRNVQSRLRQERTFNDLVHQIQLALTDLAHREEMRVLMAKAQEESELRELLEIL